MNTGTDCISRVFGEYGCLGWDRGAFAGDRWIGDVPTRGLDRGYPLDGSLTHFHGAYYIIRETF